MDDGEINKHAPLALVKTWIELAKSDKTDPEVKNRALFMLREKVGTPIELAAYMGFVAHPLEINLKPVS